MGTAIIFFCLLYLWGALGLRPSPAPARLRCYTCNFAKPCLPVPTACQDDEACAVSIGTSDEGENIERKGCLPRSQCSLPGHATYWARSYTLLHRCCQQDLCNAASRLPWLPSPLFLVAPLLSASIAWGGHPFH
ncbi:lymphocyte antigen 6G6e-like [Echinops telfairi]|uniref:Lymphocyte antigen 6G6e-like n=1 Tax=Echinops telfairi TaxID=9371 RepID=A0ABM1VKI5_ECHTE|nr:lymphocyte antigen 6G6e-like [Echinops telfairi]